jgi:colanic acid/amylovoran biosynthesis protein
LLNLGDVAMLQVAVERFAELWPGAAIRVLTESPERLARHCPAALPLDAEGRRIWFEDHPLTHTLHRALPDRVSTWLGDHELALRRRSPGSIERLVRFRTRVRRASTRPLDEFLESLAEADLVVSTGAGAFNDHFATRALEILDLLELAKRHGAATALLGHGFGPLTSARLLRRARDVLPTLDLITLRERAAGEPLLAALGVPADQMLTTGDDAVELGYRARSDRAGTCVGLNLRLARYSHVDPRSAEVAGAVVMEAAERHGVEPLSISISQHPAERDADVVAGVLDAAVDSGPDTALGVAERIGRCRVVVTGSYHAAVFALAQGIPAVGLTQSAYYDVKFEGLRDQFDGLLGVVSLAGADLAPHLSRAIDEAWQSADDVRPRLLEAARRQVEEGKAAYRRLQEIETRRSLPFNLGDSASPRWDERAEAAVELLAANLDSISRDHDVGLRIADFGAGNQRLRRVLADRFPQPHTYAAFDLHPQAEDVRRLDVTNRLPEEPFDVVFCLGLLEYVKPLESFLASLRERYAAQVLSYTIFDAPHPLTSSQRRERGWLTDYTRSAFERIAEDSGFRVCAFRVTNQERTGVWLLMPR